MVQVILEDDWRVFQVDVNVKRRGVEVYSALVNVLDFKSTAADPAYLECEGVVVTELNICQLLRAGCLVKLKRGVPPEGGGSARASPRAGRFVSGSSSPNERFSRASLGSRTPRSGQRLFTPSGYVTGRLFPQDHDVRGEPGPPDPVMEARPSTAPDGLHQSGAWTDRPMSRHSLAMDKQGYGASGSGRIMGHRANVSARLYQPKTGLMAAHEAEGRMFRKFDSPGFNARNHKPLSAASRKSGAIQGNMPRMLPPTASEIEGVDIPEMDMYNTEKASADDLSSWLDSYEDEQAAYNSTVVLAEVRMEEALKNTQGLGIPNTVRTRVVCQLMSAILGKFGRFRGIVHSLFREIMLSMYEDPDAKDAQPYFLRYDLLQKDYNTLDAQKNMLMNNLHASEAKSNNRMAYARRTMANMMKRSLKQGFILWKESVEESKQRRKQLAKIVKRWRQLDIMRAFDQWRQAVAAVKKKRMDDKMDELNMSNEELARRAKQLEEDVEKERRAKEEALRLLQEEKDRQQFLHDRVARLEAELEEAKAQIAASREDEFRLMCDEYKGVLTDMWGYVAGVQKTKCTEGMSYVDPCLLLESGEKKDDLYSVEKPTLLVRWMNHHLKRNGMEEVMNLSTDLRDGKELVLMNHLADPKRASLKWLNEVDPLRVANRVLDDACTLFYFPKGILEEDGSSITKSVSDLCYNLCAHMFEYYPMMLKNFSEGEVADVLADFDAKVATFSELSATDGVPEGLVKEIMQAYKDLDGKVRAADAEGKSREEMFHFLAMETRCYGIHMLGARIAGEPIELEDARAGEERDTYTKLNRFKVQDIMPLGDESDAELKKIEVLLSAYFKDLKRIYKFYAAGGAMNTQEYWKFVKDCKMPDKKFYGAKFDIAFQESNKEVDEQGNLKISFGAEDDDNPDFELLPGELMETLVRIAHGKYGKGTPVEKLERIIVECITPFACKSDSEEFRAKMGEKEVREIMSKHRDNMRKIFIKFSGADVATNAAAAKSSSMNLKEVEMLFKTVNLIGAGVDYTDLRKVFALVQDADGNDGDDADEDSELVFTEFLEMLGCIAIYRDPNPYIPYSKRLDTFLLRDITKPLAKKMKLTIPTAALTKKVAAPPAA